MKKTACQPTGEGVAQTPLPIQDRPSSVYHRRPNKVVIRLYQVFYWFGEFGPMFSALFGFFGRSLMVVVNFLILLGIIIISFSHSLELLRYAGLRNGLEWIGVFVWEAAFIFSSIILSRDFKKGTHGWAPWVGFLAGLSFVIVSNYMGMENNLAGKIIGVSTPLLLLVFKGVLAHQFKNRRTANKQSNTDNQTVKQTAKQSEANSFTSTTQTVHEKPDTKQAVNQTVNTSDSETETKTVKELKDKPAKQTAGQTTKQTEVSQTFKEPPNTGQSDKNNRTATKTDGQTDRASDNQTAIKQKTEQKSKQKPDTEQSNGQPNIHKVIREMIATGEQLSVRNVARKANTSNYQAHKALKEWREKGKIAN